MSEQTQRPPSVAVAQPPPPSPAKTKDAVKDGPKKSIVSGAARRTTNIRPTANSTGGNATTGISRTGTGLGKPPTRPGTASTAARKTASGANSNTTTTTKSTPTVGLKRAPTASSASDRRPSLAPSNANSTASKKAPVITSSTATTPTPTAATTVSSTSTNSPPSSSHRSRPSISSAASSGSSARHSANTVVSPRPEVTSPPRTRLTNTSVGPGTGVKKPFSTPQNAIKSSPSFGPAAVKELETLKVKYAELQGQHAALEAEFSALKSSGDRHVEVAVNGSKPSQFDEASAEFEKLKTDLNIAMTELSKKASVIIELQQKIEDLMTENQKSQEKARELAAATQQATESVETTTNSLTAKHGEEIESLRLKSIETEKELLNKIAEFEKTLEDLKASHAEQINKLMCDAEEGAAKGAGHEDTIRALKASIDAEKAAAEEANINLTNQINELQNTTKSSEEKHAQVIDNQLQEIKGLNDVIKNLQDERLFAAKDLQREFDEKLGEVQAGHDARLLDAAQELERVKEAHKAELEKGSDISAQQLSELKSTLEAKETEHVSLVEAIKQETAAQIEQIKKADDQEVENLLKKHQEEHKSLNDEIEALKLVATTSSEETEKVWTQKLADLQSTTEEQTRSLAQQLEDLRASSEIEKEETYALRKTLDLLKTDIKNKDSELFELNKQLEQASEALIAKAEEIATIKQNHDHELKSQCDSHKEEIESAVNRSLTESTEKCDSLNVKYEETLAALQAARESHSVALATLKEENHAETKKLIEDLKQVESEKISELNSSHSSALSTLQIELAAEKDASSVLKASLEVAPQASEIVRLEAALESARNENIAEVSKLSQELEDAAKKSLDMKESISASEARINETEAELQKLSTELQDTKQKADSDVKALEQIYLTQLSENDRTIALQKEKINDFEKKLAEKDNSTASLADELSNEQAEKASLSDNLETLMKEFSEFKSSKATELETLGEQISQIKKDYDAALKELEKRSQELASAQTDKEAALKTVEQELKSVTDTAQSDFESKLKEAEMEKLVKSQAESENELFSLKEKLALAEALLNEKEAAISNIKKEYDAKLKVFEAELTEAKIVRGTGADGSGDAEISAVNNSIQELQGLNEHDMEDTKRAIETLKNIPGADASFHQSADE